MDQQSKRMMDEIENISPISMDKINDVAYAVQPENLSDEMKVRLLVHRLANLADCSILQQKKDEIVQSIIDDEVPGSTEALDRFL